MKASVRIFRFRRAAVEFLEAEMAVTCAARLDEPRVRRLLAAAKRLLENAVAWEEIFLAGPAFDLPEEVREREDLEELLERARVVVLARPRPVAMPAPARAGSLGTGSLGAHWPGQTVSDRAPVIATGGGEA